MKRPLTNEFSWSKSRHEKLSSCARAYYFHYYRSWGGWEPFATQSVRQLYVLKKLSNRFTWGGSIVHAAVRGALMATKNGRTLDPARVIDRVHNVMRQDFAFSRTRRYWRDRWRKEFNGLVEHEYGEKVESAAWLENWQNVQKALTWFFSSPWLRRARTIKQEQWLEVDLMDFERSIFHLEGVKVFAVPDFAYRQDDGTTVIVDWKTGKPREGYDDQVLGYALYLSARYGLPVEQMQARLVYLNEGTEEVVDIRSAQLDRFKERFAQSVKTMRGYLVDASGNTPQPEQAFPKTDKLEVCARCVFRGPCGRAAVAKAAYALSSASSGGGIPSGAAAPPSSAPAARTAEPN